MKPQWLSQAPAWAIGSPLALAVFLTLLKTSSANIIQAVMAALLSAILIAFFLTASAFALKLSTLGAKPLAKTQAQSNQEIETQPGVENKDSDTAAESFFPPISMETPQANASATPLNVKRAKSASIYPLDLSK